MQPISPSPTAVLTLAAYIPEAWNPLLLDRLELDSEIAPKRLAALKAGAKPTAAEEMLYQEAGDAANSGDENPVIRVVRHHSDARFSAVEGLESLYGESVVRTTADPVKLEDLLGFLTPFLEQNAFLVVAIAPQHNFPEREMVVAYLGRFSPSGVALPQTS